MKRLKYFYLFLWGVLLTGCGRQTSLTLVHYNVGVFSKTDSSSIHAVAEAVKELKADAVSLNEIDSCAARTGYADQLASFAQEMGGWNSFYAAAMPFMGGKYGIGVAAPASSKVIRTDRVPLPQMDGYEPRVMAVVEYDSFVLASTHLDFASREARMAQVSQINHYMDSLYADCGKPVFLGGDFNCFPDSEPVALLKETWTLLTPETVSFPSHAPDRCIDYIFVRPNGRKVSVKEASIPQTLQTADLATASDHLPVALTVTIE